jgi:hypothetical protein
MTNFPTDPNTLSVNVENCLLQVGSNPDVYTAKVTIRPTVKRMEKRKVSTIGTSTYFHGGTDNSLDVILLMSLTEFITFNGNLTPDSLGQLPAVFFRIQYTDLSSTVKTLGNTNNSPPGFKSKVIQIMSVDEEALGGVEMRLRIRIVDDVLTVT